MSLASEDPMAVAQRKWTWLANSSLEKEGLEFSLPNIEFGFSTISDIRVAPLVQSKWNQAGADGSNPPANYPCYNYYTPPNSAGNANNYVCGCVATALAQVLRFWQYPTTGVGTASFSIKVGGVSQTRSLIGGNEAGGAYDWASMPLTTSSATTLAQRQAIGALTSDAGVSTNMSYNTLANGGSGTMTEYSSYALVHTFKYSNAITGMANPSNIPTADRNNMLHPNLDAGLPTLLAIYASGVGGHAIVCDGYGYNSATLYDHLNLGWSGSDDLWYNLPTIDTSNGTFNVVMGAVYNIYQTGSGEIISGRVTETDSTTPVSGVTVSATGTGGPYTATTNAKGIYALAKVPSGTTFTVSASKTGYSFTSQSVTTGTSDNACSAPSTLGGYPTLSQTTVTGNRWGINFVSGGGGLTLNDALDNNTLVFTTSGSANWFPETTTSYYGGSAAQSGNIGNSQISTLQTTMVGPGTLSFYFKVSSEIKYDALWWWYLGRRQENGVVRGEELEPRHN